jgi:hypothetical protein
MNKELAQALCRYVDQANQVMSEMAESHYLNGDENRQIKLLQSYGQSLIECVHASVKVEPPVVLPPAA